MAAFDPRSANYRPEGQAEPERQEYIDLTQVDSQTSGQDPEDRQSIDNCKPCGGPLISDGVGMSYVRKICGLLDCCKEGIVVLKEGCSKFMEF